MELERLLELTPSFAVICDHCTIVSIILLQQHNYRLLKFDDPAIGSTQLDQITIML